MLILELMVLKGRQICHMSTLLVFLAKGGFWLKKTEVLLRVVGSPQLFSQCINLSSRLCVSLLTFRFFIGLIYSR